MAEATANVTGSRKKKETWYHVLRDDRIFQDLLGQWNIKDSIYLEQSDWSNNHLSNEIKPIEVESFRSLASSLPFAIKFTLELHIFNNTIIDLYIATIPKVGGKNIDEELEVKRVEVAKPARRLLLGFIQQVVPTLVDMEWDVDVDNITLSELFAREIEDMLVSVKKAVADGNREIEFSKSMVQEALLTSYTKLDSVKQLVGTTEENLAGTSQPAILPIDVIRKRAKWPYAEYSCRFILGHLVPTELEIVNEPLVGGDHCRSESRRGLREGGWMIRDRFCRVTNVFHTEGDLVEWISSRPILCGRKYEMLYDKGVGSSVKIWLLSQHVKGTSKHCPDLEVTRDSFLRELGCFEGVNESKLGDRIGLAFSQTTPIDILSKDNIKLVPELFHNGYAFSDGCGVMGLNVALKIKEQYGLRHVPGAVQIRLGGIKGMLSLNTDFHNDSIGVRPSMIKFPSDHRILEVKRVAGFAKEKNDTIFSDKVFSQALLVLHDLGVPVRVLWDVQKRACAGIALEHDESCENPLELLHDDKYIDNAFRKGRKSNHELFSLKELHAMKESMTACKERVNLPAQVRVMFGIIDESSLLEEGEVLVGNGAITGDVLVFRSPCMFPGDIQKVKALPPKYSSPFVFMDNVLIFSAKGDRPLQDKLAGGDLDGDEYFVVYEPEIVDSVRTTHGHDYGTQKLETPKTPPSIFLSAQRQAVTPCISTQLAELERFIRNGNLVVDTADAWLRVADKNGVQHEESQKLALYHQQALDSKKQASCIDRPIIDFIKDTISLPHYKNGNKDARRSLSMLGIIYELWQASAKKVDILIKTRSDLSDSDLTLLDDEASQIDVDLQIAFDNVSIIDKEIESRYVEGELHRYCIVCNNPRGKKRCEICRDVWVCLGQCEINHWRTCFGIQWQVPEEDDESVHDKETFTNARESIEDTMSLTSFDVSSISYDYGVSENNIQIESQEDILHSLIRIVFSHDPAPQVADVSNINWAFIGEDGLSALRQCVLVEFYEGFKRDLVSTRGKGNFDSPHIFDVFTMQPRLASGNITLAVLLRSNPAGGSLMWHDKFGENHTRDPPFHKYRVASLSGVSRILENLSAHPADSLMDLALRRDPDSFSSAVSIHDVHMRCIPASIAATLNPSQKRAVATVLSSKFTRGFFFVMGPPGTGKTKTLAAMVASLKEGIVLASSNAAVANIAAKLLSISGLAVHEVVVFGDNCDNSIEFLSPVHRSKRFHRFKKEYDASDDSKRKQLIKEFISWLHLAPSSTIEEVIKHCPHVDTESNRGQKALTNMIKSAKAVMCTLNTAGSSFLRKTVNGRFDTLFLDEAAQCTEAEFYIATNFPGVKRIVLIGDPKQLNATVLHSDLKELGYGNSFMKNVMECRQDVAHMLGIQYRCDPAIMRFSNESYYSNALVTAKDVRNRKPKVRHPLLFINTGSELTSQGKEERYGSSWRNPFEAHAVKRLLLADDDVLSVRKEVAHVTTMVITPYRAQVNFITKLLLQEKELINVKINTVDSFQGQEADIVIFSAVRSEYEGFANDEQRLNVALTRGKRVLRVVGDLNFWSNTSKGSAMKKFVDYCHTSRLIRSDERLGKRAAAWLKPSWIGLEKFVWQPSMTSRFYHTLNALSNIDRNIALNTLLAICMPDEKSLASQANFTVPCWQQSALKGGCADRVQLVWVAKAGNVNKPKVEAHFCGKREECNNFRQTHPLIPKDTKIVKQGLTGICDALVENDASNVQSQNIDIAWTLNESIGNAILDEELNYLPDGYFDLDPAQTLIAADTPPLLIESGSGTGKTNVLFKHAVDYAYQVRDDQDKSICFVTVSHRLSQELKKRYDEIGVIERVSMPDVQFYSLRELLDRLLGTIRSTKSLKSACTFQTYVNNRTGHGDLCLDASEAENEISGVILGSLESALKRGPLERDEYIDSKRSNIDASTQDGTAKRHLVYDEYNKYRKWKADGVDGVAFYDKDDIILELISNKSTLLSKRDPLFDAIYLDEIQDFTYASIYLICSIAGRPELRWICAGDTAQMISPGCSFKFDGLKQTMLAVQPGIEAKIKKVVKLARNYRVTKDVLEVGNSILMEAKKCFKDVIEYARPEEAVKDLGTKVLWCDWDEALTEKPCFGVNQALIYTSTIDPTAIFEQMGSWLDSHPFILSTLDSKGLEFEDVVIAFDVERKSWAVKENQVSSLRLLRELYVAVTRAKRRVVILVRRNVSTMRQFFASLENCRIMESDAKTAFLEFDSVTSSEDWFKRGMKLFEDEEYKTAAGCFKAADEFSYFHWAQGKFEIAKGLHHDGTESLRKAARTFFESGEHERTLEILSCVMEMGWNSNDDYIYETSKEMCPSFFTPEQTILFALSRDKWNEISVDNLKSKATAYLFHNYRANPSLIEKIAECTEADRSNIEWSLPLVVGDYHMNRMEYSKSVKLYLEADAPDFAKAEEATNCIIQMKNSSKKSHLLIEVAGIWTDRGADATRASRNVIKDSDTFLLLHLFENPQAVSRSSRPFIAYERFGKDVVKAAFAKAKNAPMELLHNFSPNAFEVEIRKALDVKFKEKPMEAVSWYHQHNDETRAALLAMERIKELKDEELMKIIDMDLPLKGIPDEAARRGIVFQTKLIRGCLDDDKIDLAISVTDKALSSVAIVQANVKQLFSVWSGSGSNPLIKTKLGTKRRRNKPGKGITFLRLLFQPNQFNDQARKNCMQWFGATAVEYVVSQTTTKNERYAILSKFDQNGFNHLRPQPKPKPKQDMKQKQTTGTTKSKNNSRPSSSSSTTPPTTTNGGALPTEGASFKPSDTVVIKDIKAKPELNGRTGTVNNFDKVNGRYAVALSASNGQMAQKLLFKPSNLAKYVPRNITPPPADDDSTDPPSLNSRNRSASSSSYDSPDDDSIVSDPSSLSSHNEESDVDETDSDNSIPALTNRNDSSTDDDASLPRINQRSVSSSSSNDSRGSRLY